MKAILSYFVLFIAGLSISGQTLKETATQKIAELNALIITAEDDGFDAEREKLAIRTSEIFLDYADWDQNNKSTNINQFLAGWHYSDNASEMADLLPDFERQDVIDLLDERLTELTAVIAGTIVREPAVNADWSAVTQQGDQLIHEGRPVFLADWTWKPETSLLQEYHGQLDGFFITPSYVTNTSGAINASQLSALEGKGSGTMGFVFMNNRNVPQWAIDEYGSDFVIKDEGNVRYTDYDIDHPGAKDLIGDLIEGFVPSMSGKNLSGLGYMMCNEPHFITSKKANGNASWAGTGVSNYSMDLFKDSLESKHGTIANLNTVWQSNFSSFAQVSLEVPMSVGLRGTPQWYDWMRFNMDRVTNWYEFVKGEIKKSDPTGKVHLKLIPGQWTGASRDHGLDFEALTRLSDIIGNDSGSPHRSAPWNTEEWEADYKFDWREMSMAHDFFKSIHPDKIMFNSEAHYLSTKGSINLYLDPKHSRASYWLATIQGMNASQTWYWSRRENGSARNQNDTGYGGSNNHQPRVVNEVHATMMDLNAHAEEIAEFQRLRRPIRIFYSEASAINKEAHMDDLFELYEPLFFEGVPLGFVTKDILAQENSADWDVVVVYKTEYVTDKEMEALQAFVNAGGKVIIDNVSLKKNEYGGAVNGLSGVSSMSDVESIKNTAISMAIDQDHAGVTVRESSDASHPICTWKVIENAAGNKVLSILNVGKVDATLTLRLKSPTNGTTTRNLLKGIDIPNTNVLQPYDLLFVELRDEESPFEETVLGEDIRTGKIKLYPNPSSDQLKIDFGQLHDVINVRLISMDGRTVYEDQFRDLTETMIDLSSLNAGQYLVQTYNATTKETFHLVKQ